MNFQEIVSKVNNLNDWTCHGDIFHTRADRDHASDTDWTDERCHLYAPDVVEKERTIQYEGDDPNASESLTGAITYAGVSGDELMIRTNIDQYLTVGECELVLENGGTVIYSDNVEIMSSVATSACDGFSVPASELGAGEINITIKISANERKGTLRGKVNI